MRAVFALISFAFTLFLSLDIARADNLFVADYFAGTIERLALNGTSTTFGTTNQPGTLGLAADLSGDLFVGIGSTIEKFDSSGNESVFTTSLNDAAELAVDSSNNLYAINDGNVNVGIRVFSPSGALLRSIGVGDVNHNPTGLAVDAAANIFVGVSQNGTNSIEKITPTGSVSVFATLVSAVEGLAFDPSGNLYATTASSLFRYASDGTRTIVVPYGLSTPHGIASDNSGNVYVVLTGSQTIEKITPAGVSTTFASVTNAEDIAFGLSIPVATDTPVLPPGALILLAAMLLYIAGRSLIPALNSNKR